MIWEAHQRDWLAALEIYQTVNSSGAIQPILLTELKHRLGQAQSCTVYQNSRRRVVGVSDPRIQELVHELG